MTTANDTIGKLLQGEQERDAIHIAVAPVIAAHELRPGKHIGIREDGKATYADKGNIGIVDPFLKDTVQEGERFWMFLYPNTITSLRHDWAHPAFGTVLDLRTESEMWLRAFADRLFSYYGNHEDDGSRFDLLIFQAESGGFGTDIEYGEDCQPTAEFWEHFERYTGRKVARRPAHFRCAC